MPGLEDEALDPYVARFDPYRATVVAGTRAETRLIVRNHIARAQDVRVRVRAPMGWLVEPLEANALVPGGGETVTFSFSLAVPPTAAPGRVVVTADVDLGDQPRGELAETLLEVLAG